jgi:phosphoglucomutase
MLADIPKLIRSYYSEKPDAGVAAQRVAFGHFGSSRIFTELLVQRKPHSGHHTGDLRIPAGKCHQRRVIPGKDTHPLSEPAFATALEVLAANGVDAMIDGDMATRLHQRCRAPFWATIIRGGTARGRHRHYAVAQSA